MTSLRDFGRGQTDENLASGIRTHLRLAHAAKVDGPSSAALRVIAKLSRRGPRPAKSAADARRRYSDSRKPFLAPIEPVESVIHVRPPIDRSPPLTVIRPLGKVSGAPLPAIVYFHGGGWTVGDLQTYEPFCRQLANASGCVVVYVEYRLAPEPPFPAAFEDGRKAFRWLRENYEWLGIDPDRMGVGGDSSGGNLAAAISLAERNERTCHVPAFQVLLYPALDMTACMPSHKEFANGNLLTGDLYRWYRANYAAKFEKPAHWRLSPLFAHDVSELPPAIVLYAGFDPLRDEASAYARRLRRAGVPVETIFFPDMIHGFLTLGGAIPTVGVAIKRLAALLQGILEN